MMKAITLLSSAKKYSLWHIVVLVTNLWATETSLMKKPVRIFLWESEWKREGESESEQNLGRGFFFFLPSIAVLSQLLLSPCSAPTFPPLDRSSSLYRKLPKPTKLS